ncbi:MAG: Grx4 family monothiol glutaredoxin [Neomegalonema sp.]|nr:Grx4 family monothiol glutaredoxin [Neomegalonema sp.]
MTEDVQTEIKQLVEGNDVVLFMKGNALAPMCGFSSRVAAILQHGGVDFKDVNVLQSDEMRQGIKDFTNWPTVPQLYIKGEFIGGADIVTEMAVSGELDQALSDKGIPFNKDAFDALRAQITG